jgi:serine/threonine-protein kinase
MALQSVEDEGLVRGELERVLGSETFAQSEALKRFLRHVVEETLAGREGELKEQVLGADVFGRGDSYDPRIDPIVRVQATRLRGKLRDYYLKEGARSELVIDLPKGSYVPSFSKASGEPSEPRARPKPRLLVFGAAALALVALLMGSLLWNGAEPLPGTTAIAVLPFTDMSPGREYEYFGDGIADEITTALASVAELDVVPRTSAFRFKNESVDLKTLAADLGADPILQGSVRVSGGMLRVQAQLIRAADGRQLWAETYDRPFEDAFGVQEDIARAVCRAVKKELAHPPSEDVRNVPSAAAYDDFLRGTFEREKNTPLSIARSIRLLESAIEKDPDFAPAHAGLVHAYVLNDLWGLDPPSETRDAARAASERALSLDGENPQAIAAAASYRLLYEWDLTGTEELLSRGGENDEIRLVRGVLDTVRGRLDQASKEIDPVLARERHRPLPHYLGAAVRFYSGQYDEARARALSILEWAPDHALTWLLLSRIEDRLGAFDRAKEVLDRFEGIVDAPLVAGAQRALVLAHEGRTDEAKGIVRTLEEARANGYVPPALLARVYASLGDVERALASLQEAKAEHAFSLLFLAIDPDYEPLRSDPRFRALVEELGLALQ